MKGVVVPLSTVVGDGSDKMNRKDAKNAKFSLYSSCFLSDLGVFAVKNRV
jgi:hypothetical protein